MSKYYTYGWQEMFDKGIYVTRWNGYSVDYIGFSYGYFKKLGENQNLYTALVDILVLVMLNGGIWIR